MGQGVREPGGEGGVVIRAKGQGDEDWEMKLNKVGRQKPRFPAPFLDTLL